MESSHAYSVEDWLVHAFLGIGQIKAIELKNISGENVQYYRIKTTDSTFWIPVDRMDSQELRPLSTPVEIQLATAILLRPPKAMSSDHKMRKNDIRRVQLKNSLEDIARLIRDLRARQLERGELALEELNAMRALKQRLVEEWSVITGEKTDNIASTVEKLLNDQNLAADSSAD